MEEIWPEYIYVHKEDATYIVWSAYPRDLIKIEDPSERQKFLLALNLKKISPPHEAAHLYQMSTHVSGENIYIPTSLCVEQSNKDENSLDGCCQSGCRGCPWAEENIFNKS